MLYIRLPLNTLSRLMRESLKISYFEFRQGESKEHSPVKDGMTEIQRSLPE